MHHVGVMHDVVFALQPQSSAGARIGFRAGFEQLIPTNGLSPDEVLLQVGMDRAGGLDSACMDGNCPSAALIFASGEKRNQAEQGVSGANQASQAAFFQSVAG